MAAYGALDAGKREHGKSHPEGWLEFQRRTSQPPPAFPRQRNMRLFLRRRRRTRPCVPGLNRSQPSYAGHAAVSGDFRLSGSPDRLRPPRASVSRMLFGPETVGCFLQTKVLADLSEFGTACKAGIDSRPIHSAVQQRHPVRQSGRIRFPSHVEPIQP